MGEVPALFEHCVSVYKAMEEEAQLAQLTVGEEAEGLVYEGFLTRLFQELNFSVPYYSKVLTELKRMGSITQLRRGGSTTPSRWQLLGAPTPEAWDQAAPAKPKHMRMTRMDSLEQQVQDLTKRIDRIGENVDLLLQLHRDDTPHMGES